MSGEDFLKLWQNKELKAYIHEKGKYPKRIGEAWLTISCYPPFLTIDEYKHIANKAIFNSFWEENKAQLLSKNYYHHIERGCRMIKEKPTDNDDYFMADGNV